MTLACSSSAPADAGVCRSELAGDSAEWIPLGDDEQCAELGELLNGGIELGGAGECPEGRSVVYERAGVCVAEVEGECDGTSLELVCELQRGGTAAECDARVASAELDAGECLYRVLVR